MKQSERNFSASVFTRARKSYSVASVLLLNVILLFVVMNVLVVVCFPRSERHPVVGREEIVDLFVRRHGMETLRAAYPGMADQDIRELLMTTGVVANRYYPFVEFINTAFVSPTMIIRPEGFRIIGREQAPWPPPASEKTVFVFGGSTTLAVGALSHQTIPAYLQKWLRANFKEPINVYNFGTGAHYSTQEVSYFYSWLRAGFRPDLAIFIDGLNEHAFIEDRSAISGFLDDAYERSKARFGDGPRGRPGVVDALRDLALSLPIARLLRSQKAQDGDGVLVQHRQGLRGEADIGAWRRPATAEEAVQAEAVLDRYATNMGVGAAIGASHKIETLFVWQPVPLYHYDLRLHPFAIHPVHQLHRVGYPLMLERSKSGKLPANFAWCADLQEAQGEMLYVDQVHYRPVLMQRIAECTMRHLEASGAFQRLGWRRKSSDTIIPDSIDDEQPLLASVVDLSAIIEREPGRLHGANVAVDIGGLERRTLRISPVGAFSEHYLQVATELAAPDEYILSFRIKPSKATGFRLQAWDTADKPSGTIADIAFDTENAVIKNINAVERSYAQVVRRGDWYEVTLGIKLSAGLFRIIIQLLAADGSSVLAPDGQALDIQDFQVRRFMPN